MSSSKTDTAFEKLYQSCRVSTSGLAEATIAPVLEKLSINIVELFFNYDHWPEQLDAHFSSTYRISSMDSFHYQTWSEYKAYAKSHRFPEFRCKAVNASVQVSEKGKRGLAVVWMTLVGSRFGLLMRRSKSTTLDVCEVSETNVRFEWRRRSKGAGWEITRTNWITGPAIV